MTPAPRAARRATARQRFAALHDCIRTPLDAWRAMRVVCWALALPVLKNLMPLARLVRLAWLQPRTSIRRPEREARIIRLIGWVYRPGLITAEGNCLERSLVLYRFLSEQNAAPRLVVGTGRERTPFHGHAWVLVDGQPAGDSWEAISPFVPVVAFDANGRPQRPD